MHLQERRIALADIERIAANDEIDCTCGGLTDCHYRAGVNTVVVTIKKERVRFYKPHQLWPSTQLHFSYVENAEEFAEAVSRQMTILGNGSNSE